MVLTKSFMLSELERLIIERENLILLLKIVETRYPLKFKVFLTDEMKKRQEEIDEYKNFLRGRVM